MSASQTSRLTQVAVDRLRLEPRGRVELRDGTVPGLSLRASWGGTKSYFLRYRLHDDQRRLEVGKHPSCSLKEARQRARAILAQVRAGIDPLDDGQEAA